MQCFVECDICNKNIMWGCKVVHKQCDVMYRMHYLCDPLILGKYVTLTVLRQTFQNKASWIWTRHYTKYRGSEKIFNIVQIILLITTYLQYRKPHWEKLFFTLFYFKVRNLMFSLHLIFNLFLMYHYIMSYTEFY